MKPFELYTKKQVAALFQVHRHTIERRVAAGKFPPPIQVLGRMRWRKEDIDDYMRKRMREAYSR